MHPVRTIGWREHVRLPDLGIRLAAKMDSGALSSALDVAWYRLSPDGASVRFAVRLSRRSERVREGEAALRGWRWVRDSGGHGTLRPCIRTRVVLGGLAWTEDVTLAQRPGMQHRLLLGRRAMRGRLVVDASQEFVVPVPTRAATARLRGQTVRNRPSRQRASRPPAARRT